MISQSLTRLIRRHCLAVPPLLVLIGLVLLLSGCNTSGDSGSLSTRDTPGASLVRQAVDNLLDLYRQALMHEDIDRLQTLFQSTDALPPGLPTTFHSATLTGLDIPPAEVRVAADAQRVTFVEVEHVEDPAIREQQTRVYRTTFDLTRGEVGG